MVKRLNSIRYFVPLVQIALCPVTILFLWTVFTGPEAIPDLNEEINLLKKSKLIVLTYSRDTYL